MVDSYITISSDDEETGDFDWLTELFKDDEPDLNIFNERDLESNLRELETNLVGRDLGTTGLGTNVLATDVMRTNYLGTNVDEDDDCVVLECDPENVNEVDEKRGDDDELMVVGEKGEIACRDFPHARHLCAKFLFASTPHEQHCPQCHCYVCDSVAPCVYWGTGRGINDHCHSTDQDPYWKSEREYFKKGNKAPLPQIPNTPLLSPSSQPIRVPALPLNQIQSARPTAIRPCTTVTTPTNSANPILVHQGRPSHILSRNKYNPHLVARELRRVNYNQDADRQIPNTLGAQYLNRARIFKRPRSNGVSFTMACSGGTGSVNNSHVSRQPKNPRQESRNQNLASQQPAITRAHSSNDGSYIGSMPPCQTKGPSQLNSGNSFVRLVSSQPSTFLTPGPQANSQPNSNLLQNQVPAHIQVFHQLTRGGHFFLPNSELPSQPSMTAKTCENPLRSQPQVSSQENMKNIFINPVSPLSQTFNQPSFLQQGNVTAVTHSAANFLSSYMGSTDQYSRKDEIPAQDSVTLEKTNSPSFFCESDSWLVGFDDDGFDLIPSRSSYC